MRAVIMAGGKGTRLQSIASDIPKPMVPILGKPILEYQIESLKRSDIKDITLILGHLGEVIKDYFGDGSKWGVKINYIMEDKPLGTAGALYYLKESVIDDFLLVFGDLMLDVDWSRFMDFHKSKGGLVTLFGHPNAHPYDSDVIIVNDADCVIEIDSKNNVRDCYYHNLVNAGLYCVSPKLLDCILAPEKIDLERKLITNQIMKGTVFTYKSTEYVKDMGTPDRYHAVIADVINGIVASRNLRNKQWCIFLDRDGTINKFNGFINSVEKFELLPGIAEAIRTINASKYLTIVATNQPVIARGECSFEEVSNIHKKMETQLGQNGAYIDDLYFCPHHPDKGYEGEVPELKINCDCRKPKTGMIDVAAEKYNIDLSQSWYIGDTTMDIQTGKNAGMHTILVQTGQSGSDCKYKVVPEFVCPNLITAVNIIIGNK